MIKPVKRPGAKRTSGPKQSDHGTGDIMLRTDDLTTILKDKHADIDQYFERYEGELLEADLGKYLCGLLEKHGLQKKDLIFASGRERSYCYQLLNGTRRNPSRDMLLAIALGLHFTCDETQTMLRIAGLSPLYPRIRRDAVILQQLTAGKNLYECNDRLAACGEVMIG